MDINKLLLSAAAVMVVVSAVVTGFLLGLPQPNKVVVEAQEVAPGKTPTPDGVVLKGTYTLTQAERDQIDALLDATPREAIPEVTVGLVPNKVTRNQPVRLFPSHPGARRLYFKDLSFVDLPEDVELVNTVRLYTCANPCGTWPIYELTKGEHTMAVDGAGVFWPYRDSDVESEFSFITENRVKP